MPGIGEFVVVYASWDFGRAWRPGSNGAWNRWYFRIILPIRPTQQLTDILAFKFVKEEADAY